jgi:hypothetical protein
VANNGKDRKGYMILVGNLKETDHLADLHVNKRTLSTLILKK